MSVSSIFRVRPYGQADAEALARVLDACAEADGGGWNPSPVGIRRLWAAQSPRSPCLVAESAEGIVGYSRIDVVGTDERTYRGHGAVHPARRRCGIGRTLVRATDARLARWCRGWPAVGQRERDGVLPAQHHAAEWPRWIERHTDTAVPPAAALLVSEGYGIERTVERWAGALGPGPHASADVAMGAPRGRQGRAPDGRVEWAVEHVTADAPTRRSLLASVTRWTRDATEAGIVRDVLARPANEEFVLIVRHGNACGGVLIAAPSRWNGIRTAWLSFIGVAPALRRQGVATAMFARFAREFAAAGARSVALGVSASNHGARRFYERAGLHPTSRYVIHHKELSSRRSDSTDAWAPPRTERI